jgi:hypothetical protein
MEAADKTNWDMATLGNNSEKHQNYQSGHLLTIRLVISLLSISLYVKRTMRKDNYLGQLWNTVHRRKIRLIKGNAKCGHLRTIFLDDYIFLWCLYT